MGLVLFVGAQPRRDAGDLRGQVAADIGVVVLGQQDVGLTGGSGVLGHRFTDFRVGILGQEVKDFLFQVLALGQGPSNLGVLVAGQFPGLIVSDCFVVEDIHAHGVSSFAVLISFDACSEDPGGPAM